MLTDARNIWKSLQDNISNALENLDNDVSQSLEDSRSSSSPVKFENFNGNNYADDEDEYLNEAEMYKKLLDEAQSVQVDISHQSRLIVSEKEGEIQYLKKLLQQHNIDVKEELSSFKKNANEHSDILKIHNQPIESPSIQDSSSTNPSMDSLSYEQLKAENKALEQSIQMIHSQLKESMKDKSEIKIIHLKNHEYQLKINSLQQSLLSLKESTVKTEKSKTEAIENLVQEYSNLASESEAKYNKDQMVIQKLKLENEVLLTKMTALEYNITEFADRAVANSNNSSNNNNNNNYSDSNHNDTSSSSSSSSSQKLLQQQQQQQQLESKESRAKLINLQYDLKLRDEELTQWKNKYDELAQAQRYHTNTINNNGDSSASMTQYDTNIPMAVAVAISSSSSSSSCTTTTTTTTPRLANNSMDTYSTSAASAETNSHSQPLVQSSLAPLTLTQSDIDHMKEDILRLQVEKREAQAAGKLSIEQSRKLEVELSQMNKQMIALQKQNDTLTAELNIAQKEGEINHIMINNLTTAAAKIAVDTDTNNTNTTTMTAAINTQNASLQSHIDTLTTELSSLQNKYINLQNQSMQDANTAKHQHVTDIEKLNHEWEIKYTQMNHDELGQKASNLSSSLQQELQTMKQSLIEAQNSITKHQTHSSSLMSEIKELKNQQVAEIEAITTKLKEQYDDDKHDREQGFEREKLQLKASFDQELTLKVQEIALLNQSLSSLQATVTLHEVTIQDLNNQITTLQLTHIEHMKNALLQSAQEQAKALALQSNQLESTFQQHQKELKDTYDATLSSTIADEKAIAVNQLQMALNQQQNDFMAEKKILETIHQDLLVSTTTELKTQAEFNQSQALLSQKGEFELRIQQLQEAAKEELMKEQGIVSSLTLELASLEKRIKEIVTVKVAEAEVRMRDSHQRDMQTVRAEAKTLVDKAMAEREEFQNLYTKEYKQRKQIHNKLQEIQGNIRVICRVRPILDIERKIGEDADVTEFPPHNADEIIINRDAVTHNRYEYDRVFVPLSKNEEVFEAVHPLCVSVLDGYNVCIFAYGQTGSGKTHTMEGNPADPGVAPRAINQLFTIIHSESMQSDWQYNVTFSMLEIYNEAIYDLLINTGDTTNTNNNTNSTTNNSTTNNSTTNNSTTNNSKERERLDIRQTPEGNIVPGLTEHIVTNAEQVGTYMSLGQRNRAVGSHDMNEHSSRSHSILTLTCRGKNKMDATTSTFGKLHLIDLAGSERVSKTDASGIRLTEAQNINRSLSALGDVINALGNKKSTHIPYRNSKLTFLLQDSLGGNSKMLMFVAVSPAVYNVGETICSLNFASRCRNVELGQAKKQQLSATSNRSSSSSSSISNDDLNNSMTTLSTSSSSSNLNTSSSSSSSSVKQPVANTSSSSLLNRKSMNPSASSSSNISNNNARK